MFSIDESTNIMRLTRGDSAQFQVHIFYEDSEEEYEPTDQDTLTFSVKTSVNDTAYCFQKVIHGSNIFNIAPDDTKPYKFGNYVYDVQLNTATGEVHTVIEPTKFIIASEVT